MLKNDCFPGWHLSGIAPGTAQCDQCYKLARTGGLEWAPAEAFRAGERITAMEVSACPANSYHAVRAATRWM